MITIGIDVGGSGIKAAVVDTATGRGLNYDRQVNLHRSQCFR